jgi:hypothetical protein
MTTALARIRGGAVIFNTSRPADSRGKQINGFRQPIFVYEPAHDFYRLSELTVFADGLITIGCRDCDLETFREEVRRGVVATAIPDGARVGHRDLGTWEMSGSDLISEDDLIGAVEDFMAGMRGRPGSGCRLGDALEAYLADRSEQKRLALRTAYLAVPWHHRRYLLGDMDWKDWPLKVLAGEVGDMLMSPLPPFEPAPITAELRDLVFHYFEEQARR